MAHLNSSMPSGVAVVYCIVGNKYKTLERRFAVFANLNSSREHKKRALYTP